MPLRFITQIAALLIATLLLYAAIQINLANWVRDSTVYIASSIDKENRLCHLSGQRIILTGGSGVAMGMRSAYLEKASCRPVVNMGLHAALGLPFILEETLAGVRRGDLIILCPEFELNEGDPRLLAQLVDVNPEAKNFLRLPTISAQIRLRVQNLQRLLLAGFNKLFRVKDQNPVYSRQVFNQQGDAQGHYGLVGKSLADLVKIKRTQPEQNVKLLNQFILRAKAHGAQVLLTYPAYCQSGYDLNADNLKILHDYYTKNVVCPVIGKPVDFVMADSLFYDTVYHPTQQGAYVRTVKLIQILGSSLMPRL